MAKGISPLGQGLLSGIGGALGAVETDFREQRTFDRERTLEDYRFEKQKELARLKNEFDLNVEGAKAEAKVTAADTLFEREMEKLDITEAGKTERSRITASASSKDAASRRTVTEAGNIRKQADKAAGKALFDHVALTENWSEGEITANRRTATEAGGLHTIVQINKSIPAEKRNRIQNQWDDLSSAYDENENARAGRDSYTLEGFLEDAGVTPQAPDQGLLDTVQGPAVGGGKPAAIKELSRLLELATSKEEVDALIAQFEELFGSAEGISLEARGQ